MTAKERESLLEGREWSLKIRATGEVRTCSRLWPLLVTEFVPGPIVRVYYRIADMTLCDLIGHDFSKISVFHDEGEPLYECARCGEINV